MGLDQRLALAQLARLKVHNADPMERFRCSSWAQERLFSAVAAVLETLLAGGNSTGKTTGGIAVDLAYCQGRDHVLDWSGARVRVPVISPPVAWALCVPSYKLAAGSSLLKLRELLGGWPHHASKAGGADQVTVYAIRHRQSKAGDEDRSDWSRLYVFPYEGEVPEALRLDGWHCDEPPPYRFLDALRNRGKAGRRLRGFLTLTPIERKLWEPIYAEFPSEHNVPKDGRLRLQCSVYENKALSKADIERAENAVRTSPYRLARLHGEPVDIAGTCPFDTDELLKRRDECRPGTRYAVQWAQREGQPTVWPVQHAKGQLEVWNWPTRYDRCVIVADPSSGVREPDTPEHLQPRNPSGLVGLSLERQCEYVRFNGYVPAHELGQMARAVCNRSPNWVLVVETNGGWGDAFLSGFRSAPSVTQGELWYETDPDTGKVAVEPGWKQSAPKLGLLLSSLQRATETGGLRFNSRAAVDNFLRTRLDSNERWDRGDGKGPHGEDVIVYGIGAYVLERSTLPRRPSGFELVSGRPSPRPAVPTADVERW